MTAQKFVGAFFVAFSLTFLAHVPLAGSWALGVTLFIGILMLVDERG